MSSKLITPESPMLVPPLLAAEIGLSEAIILQQIHYYCTKSKHIKQDGRRWFWKTLNDWSQTLPFLKISTIRRAIANLKDKFKLIDIERHSQKTWYQANWFTVNVENLEALWNSICQQKQIDVTILDKSTCSQPADDIKDFPPEDFSSQQHSAAVSEKIVEPNWEEVEQQVNQWEQAQLTGEPPSFEQPTVTHYVDELNQDCETNAVDLHEDTFSAAVDETVEKPTREELQEVYQQLRQLPCTPAFKLNSQIHSCVAKYWHNVPGAIAYLKEAIRTWKKVDSPEAVFVKACKEGRKPDNWGKPKINHPQPTEEQLALLAAAKSRREILDLYQQPDGLWVADTGQAVIAWWDLIADAVGN
jgi:hypothetical protein